MMTGNAIIRILESSHTAVIMALIVCIIAGAAIHMLTLKATRRTGGRPHRKKK